jgi:hypothetical protein
VEVRIRQISLVMVDVPSYLRTLPFIDGDFCSCALVLWGPSTMTSYLSTTISSTIAYFA